MTTNSATLNRTLFVSDNLPVLRGLDSESVDLIATDPPFNKNVKTFEGTTRAGERVSYKDIWTWGDVQTDWTNAILADHPKLYSVIQGANMAAGDDMGAFLCWMGVRVLEMHRVLSRRGSIYLHCDSTASHYLKAMMDAVFGRENFRNEIAWCYGGRGLARRWFNKKHDIILYYVKSEDGYFNVEGASRPVAQEHVGRYNKVDEDGRRYARIKNKDGSYSNIYLKDVVREDWWEIPYVRGNEVTGYPTQKPLALYKRMIEASSDPGDMVLDPFAGCATTCVAAEQLGRHWIGVDINEQAGDIIRDRLQGEVSASMAWHSIVSTPTEPPVRTDGGDAVAPELVVLGQTVRAKRVPVSELRRLLEADHGMRCQGCGYMPPFLDYLEVDHKKPKSLGGGNELSNRTLLCKPCNLRKSNKLTLSQLRDDREREGRMIDLAWWEVERWK